jgi:predicted MFS family arabinose efflux permease
VEIVGERSSYRYAVVSFLAVVYTFNFMDRQIMSILQEPIRIEMGLSDIQLGMLTGLTFALFYTTCGLPIAWLSDRYRRVSIMAAACGIWSLFTAVCGLATNFSQLALSRVMVGAGEAGGSPPSYSLISDYFPPEKRGTGLAIYSLGVPVGSALGVAAGGWVAAHYGWRIAFFAVGLPGLVLAFLMLLLIREPKRGGFDALPSGATTHSAPQSIRAGLATFFQNRSMVLTAVSSGLSAFVGYAMLSWNPPFLERVKGMSLIQVAAWYSLVLGVTGVIGTFAAGWLVDKLGRRNPRWYAWVPAIAFTLTLPALVGLIWAPTWQSALAFLAIPALLNNMYLAPALTVVQNAAPPSQRSLAGATLLFILNLIGLGGGPLYVGYISDRATAHGVEQSLMVGYIALFPVILLTIGAHLLAAQSLRPK